MGDMALTNAEKQARWRAKRNALEQGRPDVIEAALVEEAARCKELSDEERVALADKIVGCSSEAVHPGPVSAKEGRFPWVPSPLAWWVDGGRLPAR